MRLLSKILRENTIRGGDEIDDKDADSVCRQNLPDTWLAGLRDTRAHQGECFHSVTSMYLATHGHCIQLDSLSLRQDGFTTAVVNICRCQIVQRVVIALVVIVINKATDTSF